MKIFGDQLEFVAKVIDAKQHPVDLGADDDELALRLEYARAYTKVIMQVLVSLAILVACFCFIATNSDPSVQKASFGLIGTIVGYWLR